MFRFLLFLLLSTTYATLTRHITETLSCDGGYSVTTGTPGTTETGPSRGPAGVPGKKGPVGDRGRMGMKGQKGQQGVKGAMGESCDCPPRSFTKIKNCKDVRESGFDEDGVYSIMIGGRVVDVYCDFQTDGGNWTIIQRRRDGSEMFAKDWKDYRRGFGDVYNEYWLGLDSMHLMTSNLNYELRIDIEDYENERRYAKYRTFEVGTSSSKYTLTVSGYTGNAGNGLGFHNNRKFTTRDQDNDDYEEGNCASKTIGYGGWWYRNCIRANLNGEYGNFSGRNNAIRWDAWKGFGNSLKRTEMKIRPT